MDRKEGGRNAKLHPDCCTHLHNPYSPTLPEAVSPQRLHHPPPRAIASRDCHTFASSQRPSRRAFILASSNQRSPE